MVWPGLKKKQYALTGATDCAIFGEKNRGATGQLSLQALAWANNSIDDMATLRQLLTGAATHAGEVAVSLPLNFFETVTLSINKIPDEAVGRVLPFHLAKNFDEPLDDFIYDWFITKRQKENLQITVFLFPKKAFISLSRTLASYKLNCTALEPDIFSATAYLETTQRLADDRATLIVLLWHNSLSVMVYDKGDIKLARNLSIDQPDNALLSAPEAAPPASGEDSDENNEAAKPEQEGPAESHPATDSGILADFLVMTKDETAPAPPATATQAQPPEPAGTGRISDHWQNYSATVLLELLRTRDYFTSIVKGNPLKSVIVGGAENFWDMLAPEIANGLDCDIEKLLNDDIAPQSSATLTAMAIGSLCR